MKKVISTEKAPAAIGPYSQAIEANGFVFASGQIPVDPATGEVAQGIEAQATQVMENMKKRPAARFPRLSRRRCLSAAWTISEPSTPFTPAILKRTARPAPAWRSRAFPRTC